jgi:predicted secreted protein
MAIKSFGISVTIGGTAIAELTDVTVGGVDVNFIDTTAHDSSGGWRTFLGGLTDPGTIDLTGNYKQTDAGQAALISGRGTSVAVNITFSDSTNVTCSAIVGGYNLSNPQDDKVEFTCSLKITGAITITT